MKFRDIRVIAWDFDGTLYRLDDRMWHDIFEAQYRVIMDHTGWSREKAISEHNRVYRVITQSSTDAVARIIGIPIARVVIETDAYYDRTKFIGYDRKLVDMFRSLSDYRHVMLVNGKRQAEEAALTGLGVPLSVFETWITPETTGAVKPGLSHFRALLEHTELSPALHLVVGDRETVDLVPAKSMGMKTCLVWSDSPGKTADMTLKTVYEVTEVLE